MKVLESKVTLLYWLTGVLVLVLLQKPTVANNYVEKWRNFRAITVTFMELNNKTVIQHEENLTIDTVTKIEKCFLKEYKEAVIPREHYVDVDKVLQAYGNCLYENAFAKSYGSNYENMIGKLESMLDRNYRIFDLDISLGDVRYFPVENRPPQPKTVMSKSVHNYGEKSVESVISEKVETEDVTTNTMTHTAGASYTASAEFDFLISFKTSATAGYSHTWNDATTSKTLKTLSISDTVTVPAKSSVEVTWLLTEQDFKMRWEAAMYISGAIGIKVTNDNTSKMLFLPVKDLPKFFSEIEKANKDRAYIVLKGIIQGKRTLDQIFR